MGIRNWIFDNDRFNNLKDMVSGLGEKIDNIELLPTDNTEVLNKLDLLTKPQASIWFNVPSGKQGDILEIPVYVKGESIWEISAFGLHLIFETEKLNFITIERGDLTIDWQAVSGNEATPGNVIMGGYMGAGSPIVGDSAGVLFKIKLQVIANGYTESELVLNEYVDGIVNLKPNPVSRIFAYES